MTEVVLRDEEALNCLCSGISVFRTTLFSDFLLSPCYNKRILKQFATCS